MAATLDDVKKELIDNRKVTDDILKTNKELVSEMTTYFKDLKEQARQAALDQKESNRETKSAAKTVTAGGGKGGSGGSDLNIFGLPAIAGIKTALAAITGGIIALEGAILGLRGWELGALKRIKNIGVNLTGKTAVFGTAIFTKINDAFAGTRARILRLFGLGVDGKPIVVQGKDGKVEVPTFRKITNAIKGAFAGVTTFITDSTNAIANKVLKVPGVKIVTDSISKLFSLATGFVSGTTEFIKNAASGGASKVFSTLKNLGLVISQSGVAGFLGVIGKFASKLLWPVGLLVSGYDAVMEFINTEGSVLQKTVGGVTGFVASLIGAPLDLLKNLLIKAITLFGIEVDSEGKIKPTNILPLEILRTIQSFSFQNYIKAIPQKIADIFDYILDFFKDPVGIAGSTINNVYNYLSDLFIVAMRGILSKIPLVPQSVLDMFATDREKLSIVNDKIAREQAELSNLKVNYSDVEEQMIQRHMKYGKTRAEAIEMMKQYGQLSGDFAEKNFIAQQSEINAKLAELMEERNDLIRTINQNNAQPSIVSAPTNNISNVNQGFTTPAPAPFDPRMIPGTTFQYGLR